MFFLQFVLLFDITALSSFAFPLWSLIFTALLLFIEILSSFAFLVLRKFYSLWEVNI